MHPTDKAARVAGAVYLSMAVTAPFSLLYIPRTLIVRGDATANRFAYVAMTFSSLLLRQYQTMVSRIAFPALFGEVAITLWLLIKGAKVQLLPAPDSGSIER